MHREHDREVDVGGSGRGVPVVQVQDVGPGGAGESGDGDGEAEEPRVVVGPALAARVDVRVRPRDPGDLDEREPAERVVPPTARDGRACPGRDVQLEPLRPGELDARVVGEDDLDLHTLRAELAREPRHGVREAADGRDGRQLRGGEEDAHATRPGGGRASDRAPRRGREPGRTWAGRPDPR